MSEPAINHLLEWFETFYGADDPEHDPAEYQAIRAILEQHRFESWRLDKRLVGQVELEAIRAFVERVEKRVARKYDGGCTAEAVPMYLEAMQELDAMQDELAKMEKEAE